MAGAWWGGRKAGSHLIVLLEEEAACAVDRVRVRLVESRAVRIVKVLHNPPIRLVWRQLAVHPFRRPELCVEHHALPVVDGESIRLDLEFVPRPGIK